MDELAAQMDKKGNDRDSGRQPERPEPAQAGRRRQAGGREVPGMKIVGTFYHIETPQDAAAEVIRVQNAYPQMQGWAMIGGWPLFTPTLLKDLDPKQVEDRRRRRAARGARLRREGPRAGAARPAHVSVGLRVACSAIVDKVHLKQDVPQIIPMELVRVTKENLGAWARQLKDWGFTDVPEEYLKCRRRVLGTTTDSRSEDRRLVQRCDPLSASSTSSSASPACRRSRTSARGRGRALPCAVRRERRGEEHARQDPRRHLRADAGRIDDRGRAVRFGGRREALAAGIGDGAPGARVLREPLGRREPLPGALPREGRSCRPRGDAAPGRGDARRRSARTLDVDARRSRELSIGQQQMLQIAAAVGRGARIIVFDEPTSSLSQHEARSCTS